MYEFLVQNPVIAIVFVAIVAIIALFILVKVMQRIGLERIRRIVYDGFVEAEHEFLYGENTQKFEYVVQLARNHLPMPFSLFITESLLRRVIQLWFDLCKDLLDDGKVNGTGKEEVE